MNPRNRTSGFTIIELIVVIALLGIIATVVVPNLDNMSPRYKLRAAGSRLQAVGTKLQAAGTKPQATS